jgi:hypothetical protein
MPVVFDVQFGCLGGMMSGVVGMPLRRMSMVSGRLVVARFVMPGGFEVVVRRLLMMFRCFAVMLRCLF